MRAFISILCLLTLSLAQAQEGTAPKPGATLPLWPEGRMPGKGAAKPEEELPARGDNVQRITNVSQPTLAVFSAAKAGKAAPAVVICPGGGYGLLCYNKEGTEAAAWLNTLGITGIVLKYRVPGNHDGAFQDVQRAVRLARAHAGDWNIAPDRIGVMGFSAGGHLAARLSNNFQNSAYPKIDSADEQSCQPNFAILVYPAYLAPEGVLSPELPVSAQTAPTFIVHTEDDAKFIPGTKIYHAALEAAHVPNEFFLCAKGGHGYGLRSTKEVGIWPKKCEEWLRKLGVR